MIIKHILELFEKRFIYANENEIACRTKGDYLNKKGAEFYKLNESITSEDLDNASFDKLQGTKAFERYVKKLFLNSIGEKNYEETYGKEFVIDGIKKKYDELVAKLKEKEKECGPLGIDMWYAKKQGEKPWQVLLSKAFVNFLDNVIEKSSTKERKKIQHEVKAEQKLKTREELKIVKESVVGQIEPSLDILKGGRVVIKNYKANSTEVPARAIGQLNKVAEELKKNPNSTILITGHTDRIDEDPVNSWKRGMEVKNYFIINLGIEKKRINFRNKRGNEPISSNKITIGRYENRRVEITIVPPKITKKPAKIEPREEEIISSQNEKKFNNKKAALLNKTIGGRLKITEDPNGDQNVLPIVNTGKGGQVTGYIHLDKNNPDKITIKDKNNTEIGTVAKEKNWLASTLGQIKNLKLDAIKEVETQDYIKDNLKPFLIGKEIKGRLVVEESEIEDSADKKYVYLNLKDKKYSPSQPVGYIAFDKNKTNLVYLEDGSHKKIGRLNINKNPATWADDVLMLADNKILQKILKGEPTAAVETKKPAEEKKTEELKKPEKPAAPAESKEQIKAGKLEELNTSFDSLYQKTLTSFVNDPRKLISQERSSNGLTRSLIINEINPETGKKTDVKIAGIDYNLDENNFNLSTKTIFPMGSYNKTPTEDVAPGLQSFEQLQQKFKTILEKPYAPSIIRSDSANVNNFSRIMNAIPGLSSQEIKKTDQMIPDRMEVSLNGSNLCTVLIERPQNISKGGRESSTRPVRLLIEGRQGFLKIGTASHFDIQAINRLITDRARYEVGKDHFLSKKLQDEKLVGLITTSILGNYSKIKSLDINPKFKTVEGRKILKLTIKVGENEYSGYGAYEGKKPTYESKEWALTEALRKAESLLTVNTAVQKDKEEKETLSESQKKALDEVSGTMEEELSPKEIKKYPKQVEQLKTYSDRALEELIKYLETKKEAGNFTLKFRFEKDNEYSKVIYLENNNRKFRLFTYFNKKGEFFQEIKVVKMKEMPKRIPNEGNLWEIEEIKKKLDENQVVRSD
jgi:outer membrane protein OmpA-like peptidoglycan-associated protein